MHSQYARIDRPGTPFERPDYKVLSPPGERWVFTERDDAKGHHLFFAQDPRRSSTYSLYAMISDSPSVITFSTPQEFLFMYRKMADMTNDPRRTKVVKSEVTPDKKFGDYSVLHYSSVEDHRAANRGNAPYLLTQALTYCFIHPRSKQVISVTYSERGLPAEMDEKFVEKAKAFADGLTIK